MKYDTYHITHSLHIKSQWTKKSNRLCLDTTNWIITAKFNLKESCEDYCTLILKDKSVLKKIRVSGLYNDLYAFCCKDIGYYTFYNELHAFS